MLGSFIIRIFIMALGYAYPAYECYKTVEMNRPDIEQLRFWCQYWILVALITIFERFGDVLISWLPMYNEAKLAFFLYLWLPKTRGTTYVYNNFLQPYVAQHETEIDRNLLELRARAGDSATVFVQKTASYGQARFLEILQYIATHSQSIRPRFSQQYQQQQQPALQQEVFSPPPIASVQRLLAEEQSRQQGRRPGAGAFKSLVHEPVVEEAGASFSPSAEDRESSSHDGSPTAETTHPSKPSETEEVQEHGTQDVSKNADSNPPPTEVMIEEAIRATRGRLRKTASSSVAAAAATH